MTAENFVIIAIAGPLLAGTVISLAIVARYLLRSLLRDLRARGIEVSGPLQHARIPSSHIVDRRAR